MESIGKIKALADNIRLQAGFCETLGYLKFWSGKWVFKDTQVGLYGILRGFLGGLI